MKNLHLTSLTLYNPALYMSQQGRSDSVCPSRAKTDMLVRAGQAGFKCGGLIAKSNDM